MALPWEPALAATKSVALVRAASLEIRASAAETMRQAGAQPGSLARAFGPELSS